MTDDGVSDGVRELLADAGIHARPLRAGLDVLCAGPADPAGLVAATGLTRRGAEALLRAVGDDAEDTDGGRRVRPDRVGAYRRLAAADRRSPAADRADRVGRFVATAPAPDRDLDHVAATPDTVLRRADFLTGTYDLAGRRVLCLGDHDLTSLAVRLTDDRVDVRVVDLDDRVLAHIDAQDLGVECVHADLRLGLPAVATGDSDVVLTDPPYTPAGVGLFLARAVAALRDQGTGRILLAYGFGEQPALGLAVQEEIHRLHLVIEAALPGFNRYAGAQAIGSAATLYVLRPTTRSAAAARDRAGAARLYTGGAQSAESTRPGAAADDLAAALDLLPGGDRLLVGAGPDAGGSPDRRVTLSRLLSAPLPERDRARPAAVDLVPAYGSSLARVLLACTAPVVAVLCPNGASSLSNAAGQADLRAMVAPAYDISRILRSTPRPDLAIVLATRRAGSDDAAAHTAAGVARHVYARPHGRLANVWVEALAGLPAVTRAAAHEAVRELAPDLLAGSGRRTLLDLPGHRLAVLPAAIEKSVVVMGRVS